MALDSWLVGYGIEYTDGGAPGKLDILARATTNAGKSFDLFTVSVRESAAACLDFSAAAKEATAAVRPLSRAFGTSAKNSDAAAVAADRVAASYDATATAADAAAASVGRYNVEARASRRGGGPGGIGGGGGGGGAASAGAAGFALGGPVGAAASIAGHVAKAGIEAVAAFTADSLYEAGHYQTTMAAIKNVSGAAPWQMAQINAMNYKQGSQYNMSPEENARMFLDVVRQTPSMTIAQKEAMMPYLGQASVVLGATRGMKPEAVSEAAISFVHMFQAYKPEQMGKMFDLFTRSTEMMGTSPTRALSQYAYFVPGANRLGVDPVQDMVIMAELANMGMGKNRGGTGIAGMMNSAMGIGVGGDKALPALEKLGVLNAKGKSNFYQRDPNTGQMGLNMMAFLHHLEVEDQKMLGPNGNHEAFFDLIKAGFGIIADKTALALTSKVQDQQRQAQYGRFQQKSLGLGNQYHELYDENFDKQFSQAGKNFQALGNEVGGLMLPAATEGFHELQVAIASVTTWLQRNKGAEGTFVQALIDDERKIVQFFRDNGGTFKAIGTDLTQLAEDANLVLPAVLSASSGILYLVRAIGDIATGQLGDLGQIGTELRVKNTMARISNMPGGHDAKMAAYRAAIAAGDFSVGDLPDNVRGAFLTKTTKGPTGWGTFTGPNAKGNGPARPTDLIRAGPHGPFGGLNFMKGSVVIDARGMTPEQATKVLTDGTVAAAKKLLKGPDGRVQAGKRATIHSGPTRPVHETTTRPQI